MIALVIFIATLPNQAVCSSEDLKNDLIHRYNTLQKIIDTESKKSTTQSSAEASAFEEMIFLEPLAKTIEAKQPFDQITCKKLEIRIKNLSPQKKNKYQQSSMEILKKICSKN